MEQTKIFVYAGWENDKKIGTIYSDILNGSEVISFEYENEIRLIGDFKKEPVKFREKNGYIIPYKEIYFSKKQIKSITLGPCQNLDKAEYSLRQFLDSKGFEHVMIHKSIIPYRNI